MPHDECVWRLRAAIACSRSASWMMCATLVPLYAVKSGISLGGVGLIMASYELAVLLAKPWCRDFVRQLPSNEARVGCLLFGLKLGTVSILHLGFASSTHSMVLARVAMGAGDALICATLGWHDSFSNEEYAARTGSAMGIGFGPLLAGILVQYMSYRTAFFTFALLVAALGFIISLVTPRLVPDNALFTGAASSSSATSAMLRLTSGHSSTCGAGDGGQPENNNNDKSAHGLCKRSTCLLMAEALQRCLATSLLVMFPIYLTDTFGVAFNQMPISIATAAWCSAITIDCSEQLLEGGVNGSKRGWRRAPWAFMTMAIFGGLALFIWIPQMTTMQSILGAGAAFGIARGLCFATLRFEAYTDALICNNEAGTELFDRALENAGMVGSAVGCVAAGCLLQGFPGGGVGFAVLFRVLGGGLVWCAGLGMMCHLCCGGFWSAGEGAQEPSETTGLLDSEGETAFTPDNSVEADHGHVSI